MAINYTTHVKKKKRIQFDFPSVIKYVQNIKIGSNILIVYKHNHRLSSPM